MTDFGGGEAIAPNAPLVVSETIDGEAIVMHHGTGKYFDTSGSGALLWQAIEGGTTIDALAARLAHGYAIDPERAEAVTRGFVARLAEHDLIRSAPAGAGAGSEPALANEPFAEPVLGVHADLADMLLLDPIHDVDDSGWPAARPASG